MTVVVIVALGAVTPVGLSAAQTALVVRATVRPVHELPFDDALGESIGGCFVPSISHDIVGDERLVALAAPALREVMAQPPVEAKLPLVLAVGRAGAAMPRELLETDGARGCDASAVTVLRAGHAGFGYALAEAARRIEDGADEVLVGAVDSYCDPFILRALDKEFAILSRRSPQGFVPSEAAVFARVTKKGRLAASLATVIARVDVEPTAASGEPNVAVAMTRLVASFGEHLREPARWLVTDVNGEPHRSRELTLVETRSDHVIARDATSVGIGVSLGDVGAASLGVATVLVAGLSAMGVAPSMPALLLGAADSGERAAILVGSGRPEQA
ncbi:MAG TPA: hypothetical protein VL400_15040 [Polyangiaceae bacterium]|nr:hypothetical protein [Polyangiaceae bacterium]